MADAPTVAGTPDRVPVTIITGFLGAGKSTLVQQWLTELSGRPDAPDVAVIVNERGDIGIDGELLAAHVARLTEITGGCVCCTSQVELVSALTELAQSTPRPGRIVVETSGAASPAQVIRVMTGGRGEDLALTLDGVVTVLDASRLDRVLSRELAVEQLAFADVVVLSHLDRLAEDRLAEDRLAGDRPSEPSDGGHKIHSRVREYAPAAVVTTAAHGVIPDGGLDGALAQRSDALYLPGSSVLVDGAAHEPQHHEPQHHEAIEAVSLLHSGWLGDERFADWVEAALGAVEGRILRLKGILAMAGVPRRVIVHGVGEAVEVTLGRSWEDAEVTSRLVVLGLGLDAAALEAGFRDCAMERGGADQ